MFFAGSVMARGWGIARKPSSPIWVDKPVTVPLWEERGTGSETHVPVWLLSAWVRRGLTAPMGVPKMWVEGRLKVEPARENT